MADLEIYLEPFRTYMQTLVSQVLDSSFISVVLNENGMCQYLYAEGFLTVYYYFSRCVFCKQYG
jgi:hypothetical protein